MNISDLELKKGHRSRSWVRVSVGVSKDGNVVGLTLSLDREQFV